MNPGQNITVVVSDPCKCTATVIATLFITTAIHDD
jgi:hypothetical protein